MASVNMSFGSIAEFSQYLKKTPTSKLFLSRTEFQSKKADPRREWSGTESFEEAEELLRNGWEDMARRLEQTLSLKANSVGNKIVKKSKFDVVGFQASVPRFLQGIPTNMVNQKQVVQKQKIITLVKHIGYRGDVDQKEILENSLKALQIVKILEDEGLRINLDVISPASVELATSSEQCVIRVRIKSAGERLNISKVAFPLVHPSMLRRMILRFREVVPGLEDANWASNYGYTLLKKEDVRSKLKKGEYYLHNFLSSVEEEINEIKKI